MLEQTALTLGNRTLSRTRRVHRSGSARTCSQWPRLPKQKERLERRKSGTAATCLTQSAAPSGAHLRSYMRGGHVARRGRATPSDQHKPHDPAILIWVPVGETPTAHAVAVSGASTFSFLPDAVHSRAEGGGSSA